MTVSIEDRPPLQVTPIRQRGWMMGPLPLWAEVAYAAVENTTNGVIAVTGNMLGIGVDVVSAPIFWHVKDGKVRRDRGRARREGAAARHRGRAQRRRSWPSSPSGRATSRPSGRPSEKGRIGNVHFAMGDNKNAYPGGQNSCRLHLDGVVRNATLEIMEGGKGGYIFRDGQWDV